MQDTRCHRLAHYGPVVHPVLSPGSERRRDGRAFASRFTMRAARLAHRMMQQPCVANAVRPGTSLRALLAVCGLVVCGCRGDVVASGLADAASGSDGRGETTLDSGDPDNPSGDAGSAAACSAVLASSYDQSCVVDTDCVAVGEIPSCPASGCDGCTTAAVNKSVMTQYATAFAQAFASKALGTGCGCPCESGALCRGGKCQAGFCGPPPSDTLPACADAGGMCAYSANTTCSGTGPPDACAYPDEFCCLN
jgi:hypothetical protein